MRTRLGSGAFAPGLDGLDGLVARMIYRSIIEEGGILYLQGQWADRGMAHRYWWPIKKVEGDPALAPGLISHASYTGGPDYSCAGLKVWMRDGGRTMAAFAWHAEAKAKKVNWEKLKWAS